MEWAASLIGLAIGICFALKDWDNRYPVLKRRSRSLLPEGSRAGDQGLRSTDLIGAGNGDARIS
jgi:hypothetical protein